jgi:hypothetical protein
MVPPDSLNGAFNVDMIHMKFLHSPNSIDLCMNFRKIMLVVDAAMRSGVRIPQVELQVSDTLFFRSPQKERSSIGAH